jgi:hypothetical protein
MKVNPIKKNGFVLVLLPSLHSCIKQRETAPCIPHWLYTRYYGLC